MLIHVRGERLLGKGAFLVAATGQQRAVTTVMCSRGVRSALVVAMVAAGVALRCRGLNGGSRHYQAQTGIDHQQADSTRQ